MLGIFGIFIAALVLGMFCGPLVDKIISLYTNQPLSEDKTPLEMLIERIKHQNDSK